MLTENIEKLHAMASALVKYETIGESQIKDIMEGRVPQPPEDWDDTIEPQMPGGDDGSATAESGAKGTIGGPASEH
jgi:cell division protease FtsH